MSDIIDAYSIHVFWDYWDTPKLQQRLTEVRTIVDSLPAAGRKPLYVTEYAVRGIRAYGGATLPEPGVFADGTPMRKANINGFQHLWFDVRYRWRTRHRKADRIRRTQRRRPST
jgi:hypothetical protein